MVKKRRKNTIEAKQVKNEKSSILKAQQQQQQQQMRREKKEKEKESAVSAEQNGNLRHESHGHFISPLELSAFLRFCVSLVLF